MGRGKFLDIVVCGPDMSGTSTQIEGIINFFQNDGKTVKDLRGTEIDALFHTEKFQDEIKTHWGNDFINLSEFLFTVKDCASTTTTTPENFLWYAHKLLSGGGTNQDLRVASMVKNKVTTYIDPNSADVWILEEPTKRGSGQVNRVIEQNRSEFGDELNPKAAAESHSVYRTDEFLRFRKPLRENNKIIVRSRSEESACYQVYDKDYLSKGVSEEYYLQLEGHKIAFANSPTNLFVVCGPENWKEKDYLEFRKSRSNGRDLDDHEKKTQYQLLVNKRYATDWLENLYKKACKKYGSEIPEITRFDIYASREEINQQMANKISSLL